jgi:hypothetical protein
MKHSPLPATVVLLIGKPPMFSGMVTNYRPRIYTMEYRGGPFRRLVVGFPPRRPAFDPISCGIGAVFRFPLPILILPTAPYLLIILSPTLYKYYFDADSVADSTSVINTECDWKTALLTRGSVVGCGTLLQAGRSRVRVRMR